MKNTLYLLLAFLCAVGLTACQDELQPTEGKGADPNRPSTVEMTFGVPQPDDIVVSRAGDDQNSYSVINDLTVFVFDGDTYLGRSEVTGLTKTTVASGNPAYKGNVTLYNGTQTVYAVANAKTTTYWDHTADQLEQLEDAAQTGGREAFLDVTYSLATATTESGTLPVFSGMYMPLSGKGEVTVTGSTASGTVSLKRMVARVDFVINTVHTKRVSGDNYDIVFTPQTWQVYNVPRTGYPISDGQDMHAIATYNMLDVEQIDPAETTGEKKAYITDRIFLPENLHRNPDNLGESEVTGCNSYNDRERKEDNGTWTNAPHDATYIVIKGTYKETDSNGRLVNYADVAYTIHLGDFSDDDYNNFDVERNCRYIYTITVQGVDQIIVEAEKQDETNKNYQHGAEGNVIGLDQYSKMFRLDAHYEQVYVRYGLSDVVDAVRQAVGNNPTDEKVKEAIANNFILSIHTPMNIREASEELVRPYLTDNEEDAMRDIDYKWIEFLPLGQPDRNNNHAADGIAVYPSDKSLLLSAWTVCKQMGEAVYQIYNGDNPTTGDNPLDIYRAYNSQNRQYEYYVRFTIFVDEYFYLKNLEGKAVAWGEFTNKEPRTLLIASDMQVSSDHNSTYSTALTYITQTPIYTFYRSNSAENTNAMGIETYCENCSASGDSQGALQGFGTVRGANRWNDQSNGRINMINDIQTYNTVRWNSYIDFTKVGYRDDNSQDGNEQYWFDYHSGGGAYYACLSRNRDLNGNGQIDDDEIRWYLPALSQYQRIGISTKVLPQDTRLYTGDKMAMVDANYPKNYVRDGALYYTNTSISDYDYTLYWAAEVGAYGSEKSGYNPGYAKIRCVRNLPSGELLAKYPNESDEAHLVGDEALAIPVYGSLKQLSGGNRNYMFDFGDRLMEALFRNTGGQLEGGYGPHDEMGDNMKLPQAFVVSEDYIGDRSGNRSNFSVAHGYGITPQVEGLNINWNYGDDPCSSYYESYADRGKWRTPNLNELMVMTTVVDKLGLKDITTLSRTQFSNTTLRSGYRYNGSIITATTGYNVTGAIRCVRDATEAEISSAVVAP